MKILRRSIKGEKPDTRLQHISIAPKSAIAIVPPKKVIKALYDYEPEPNGNNHELAFHKGDFFHVISREDDPHWYEACNPLIPDARGLVPVSYFEVIGKTERQSAGSAASGASNTLVDSGYAERVSHSRSDSSATARTPGHARMSSLSKASGAMVYGIVQYDFSAERPDELEAKAGEAIIVIAQSNPEWFVAKPIGRLGGPGLIPVSFIEIRDMTTGQAVPDAHEAVQRAGVPKVEEWKKMAAEYKNSSITLGKFEANRASLQRDLEQMSLNNGSQPYAVSNGNLPGQGSNQQNGSRAVQNTYNRQSSSTLLAPISASIPRYCFENDKYWYIIECVLEDGRHWELSRFYQNFYDFQIALLQEFPKEAGQNGGPRILPFMPGPVTYVTDAISNGRRESLNDYLKKLLALPPYISKCQLVRQLFAPREGDFELDPRAMGEDYRLSGASQQSSGGNSLPRTASQQSSRGQLNGNGYPPGPGPAPQQRTCHQPEHSAVSTVTNDVDQAQQHYRSPSDAHHSAPINRQPSSLTQASATSSGTHHSASLTPAPTNTSTTNVASGALKIKVFFEDDLIAIRVPSDIGFQHLRDKLKDRLKVQNEIMIQYKDEPSGGYAELLSDRDLDVALQRNPKLTLYVGYA
ncbi:bud emergence protein 1 [Lignoscripta atroalba]|nr:bud emergence protein 1 [Lignoscripta atroalba]